MVRNIFIATLGTKIPDKQAIGVGGLIESFVGPALALACGQQVAIGPGRISIGYYDVGVYFGAIFKGDARYLTPLGIDLCDLSIVENMIALPLDQRHEAID